MHTAQDERRRALDELDAKLAHAEGEAALWEDKTALAAQSVAAYKTGIAHLHAKYCAAAVDGGDEDGGSGEPDNSGASAHVLAQAPAPQTPDGDVTEHHMAQFLGVLEHRAEKMLLRFLRGAFENQGHSNPAGAAHVFLHPVASGVSAKQLAEKEKASAAAAAAASDASASKFSFGKKVEKKEADDGFKLPSIADAKDDDGSDDDNLVPLTREQLQQRAMKDMPDASKKGKKAAKK